MVEAMQPVFSNPPSFNTWLSQADNETIVGKLLSCYMNRL